MEKTLHDEYLALAWIMLTAALDVINVFWFGQAFSFSSWIKLSCSLMYSAFMVYYACSASGRTFYFYITIAAGLLAAADCLLSSVLPDGLLIPAGMIILLPYSGVLDIFSVPMNGFAAVLLFQAVLLAVHWLFRRHGQDAHEDHFA